MNELRTAPDAPQPTGQPAGDHQAPRHRRGRRRPGVLDELARVNPDGVLTVGALASFFKRSPRSVRRMATRGELPASFNLAGRRVWLAGAVVAHLRSRQAEAISARSAPRGRL